MPSRRKKEPEAAADEYQAPFTLPVRNGNSSKQATQVADDDADDMASSPFFDDKEHAEAMAWARSDEGMAQEDNEGAAPGSVRIRKRRDSQVGNYGDAASIFDGPVAGAVPSSVSSMHHTMARPELGRRASSRSRRRISRESSRRHNATGDGDGGDFDDAASATSGRASVRSSGANSHFGRKRRIPAAGDDDDNEGQSRGMLGSLLASIRGDKVQDDDARSRASRRPSIGRRQSSASSIGSGRASSRGDEEDEDGFDIDYGTDDDDFSSGDSMRSTTSDEDGGDGRGGIMPSAFGPISGAVDPVFGDSRISTGREPEDELDAELQGVEFDPDTNNGFGRPSGPAVDVESGRSAEATRKALEELSYLDRASRARQQIYLPDEDSLIRFTGYQAVPAKKVVWTILCILSIGIIYLIGRWLPKIWLRWTCRECNFDSADFVVVENQFGDLHLIRPETVPFARPLATAFPPSSRDPPSTLVEHQSAVQSQLQTVNKAAANRSGSKVASAKSSIRSGKAGNGNILQGNDSLIGQDTLPTIMAGVETEQLMDLTMMTYRYTRFFLHPPSGRWRMIKDWRDPLWTSNSSVSQGVTWDAEKDRMSLFGKNEIEIEDKGVIGVLVDEVLHPFYSG